MLHKLLVGGLLWYFRGDVGKCLEEWFNDNDSGKYLFHVGFP